MNGRCVAIVGVLCVAVLAVSGAYADKPENPGKPDKPHVPGQTKAECIVFTGDLQSVQDGVQIEGCCLNAGPWPEYTMILDLGLTWPDGEVDGFLHIGSWYPGPDGGYVVQFWTWDDETEVPGAEDFLFEVWGGQVERDKKSKLLTVTFDGDSGTLWGYHEGDAPIKERKYVISNPTVTFVLHRTSDLDFCKDYPGS